MGAGRFSLTAAHQRRGPCNGRLAPLQGEAQNGLSSRPTGGAASSGFCRSARSVRVGPGGRPRRLSIISIDVAFRCDVHGRPARRLSESRVGRERTDDSDLLRWRARRLPERSDPWLQKGAPPSLARRHPNAEKARSGMDILHPTPKFGSGRIFTPRRRSRSRGRETFGHAVEPNDSPAPRGANAWDQRAPVPRGCAPLARSARIGSGIERSARSANGRPAAVTQVVAIAPRVTAVARFGTIWVSSPRRARGYPAVG
jgi:hypothetical protein